MVDYSYRRPSRRAHDDVILPTLQRPIPDVAIVVDTSGSMDDDLLGRALAEVEGVLKRAGLRQCACSRSTPTSTPSATSPAPPRSLLAGGGGTDMGEGIAAAAALRPRPSVVVVLTDGYTPWPDRAPPGMRVVVGLLGGGWEPPRWAAVLIET